MRDIRGALDDLLPLLRLGHSLTLRSTVAPGTTDFVAGYLRKHRDLSIGADVFVAHAPERIAAGRFFEEIVSLPCIVGGVGERSGEVVGDLFSVFGAPIVQTTPIQAELAKIWTNILRYVEFALPNRLMMECEQYGANVFEVIDLVNRDYPRGGMKLPGFTAGTCLRKDFTFSEERSPAPGMLLAVSRVHESVPLFVVEGLKRRLGSLSGRKVAVLGLAFKADTDDERDSLSHKLIRLLERDLADVVVHDPHVQTPTASFADAVLDADAVVIATNHTRVPRARRAPRDRRLRPPGRGDRGPVEHVRGGAGVRLRERAGGARAAVARGGRRSGALVPPRARRRQWSRRWSRPGLGLLNVGNGAALGKRRHGPRPLERRPMGFGADRDDERLRGAVVPAHGRARPGRVDDDERRGPARILLRAAGRASRRCRS